MPQKFSKSAAGASSSGHALRALAAGFSVALAAGAGEGCQMIAGPDWSRIYLAEGGAGGQGGPGGIGGMGGMGGQGPACLTADDCPWNDTECRTRTCEGGQCGFALAPAGKKIASQAEGDCFANVCDGEGGVTTAADDADVLDDKNACTVDICVAGSPVNAPNAPGSACDEASSGMCDGEGACVECLTSADCQSGICQTKACVPASCDDAIKNGSETDVDCGGVACNPCGDLEGCAASTDCESGFCEGGACALPSCTDGVENGSETGNDCGGLTCAPCGPGEGCAVNADCTGGACSGTVCLPTCSDTVQNASETGVDCGGPACGACPDGGGCATGADCESGVCEGSLCAAPSCADGVKNGAEAGVDCGGDACPACPTGEPCTVSGDCSSGVCEGGVCAAPACGDGVKNGAEACDDGNDDDTDACLVDCSKAACGDGHVRAGVEMCDDGNDDTTDACAVCQPAVCGDGYLQAGVEACDDGNDDNVDACTFACLPAACGDGYVYAGFEACDDGSTASGDGCDSGCASEVVLTEVNPNNNVANANARALDPSPVIIAGESTAIFGSIAPKSDADVFKMTLATSALVRIETFDGTGAGCSGGITTTARLLQSAGLEIAADPTTLAPANGPSGIGGCSAIVRSLPPGTYYVKVEETGGDAGVGAYMLQVKIHSASSGEVEPNDTPAMATSASGSDIFVYGGHFHNGDADYFAIPVPPGRSIRAEVIEGGAETCESGGVDSLLTLLGPDAVDLASDDDTGRGACSLIDGTGGPDARHPGASGLPGGTYYVRVKASPGAQFSPDGQFDYQVAITVR